MATEIDKVEEEIEFPKPRLLSPEEDREMTEKYAQKHFGMSVAEFLDAWEAGEFDGKPELHDSVVGLAMQIPEAWDSNAW